MDFNFKFTQEELRNLLLELMMEKCWGPRELCQEAGIDRITATNFLKGKKVTLKTFMKLMKLIKIDNK